MDAAGARELARRIAEGKQEADTFLEPTRPRAPSPKSADGVVYIRPLALGATSDVRIYVRGPDGRLRRAR
jgi:hypothetical protein